MLLLLWTENNPLAPDVMVFPSIWTLHNFTLCPKTSRERPMKTVRVSAVCRSGPPSGYRTIGGLWPDSGSDWFWLSARLIMTLMWILMCCNDLLSLLQSTRLNHPTPPQALIHSFLLMTWFWSDRNPWAVKPPEWPSWYQDSFRPQGSELDPAGSPQSRTLTLGSISFKGHMNCF